MEKNKVLRPGMYIRTKDGYIRYIIDIIFPRYKNPEWFLLLDGKPFDTRDLAEIGKNIAKYSFNLIDLIEVGDYANGYKILEIVKGFKVIVDKLELNTRDGIYHLKQFTNNEIKSIVTKEVFKANEYRMETD